VKIIDANDITAINKSGDKNISSGSKPTEKRFSASLLLLKKYNKVMPVPKEIKHFLQLEVVDEGAGISQVEITAAIIIIIVVVRIIIIIIVI